MNDKDREMLAQILHSAGSVGEQGFAYLVRYRFYDGLTTLIGCAIAIAGFLWLLRRVFAWEIEAGWENDGSRFAKSAAMVALTIAICACLFGVFSGVTAMLAPEGVAIQSAIAALTHKS